jgi:RHS repeat-associated protein
LGSGFSGVFILDASDNTIGGEEGTSPDALCTGACNLISASGTHGVLIQGFSSTASGNRIQGNFIGTDVTGTSDFGNAGSGVSIEVAENSQIGGSPNLGNLIAFSRGNGVQILAGSGNAIQNNSIFSISGLGIDLNADGVTENDSENLDSDTGANNLQNFPELTMVGSSGGITSVQGSLVSTPNSSFALEFFATGGAGAAGNREGKRFLGFRTVATNGEGLAAFAFTIPAAVADGEWITATATDAENNTSEFSAALVVGDPQPPIVAALIAPDIGAPDFGETSYSFVLTYSDTAIDVSSIDVNDVTVTGPGGPLTIDSASVDIATDGSPRSATYTAIPPGGSWDTTDNGTYQIGLQDNQVFNAFGAPAVGSVSLGGFVVDTSTPLFAINDKAIAFVTPSTTPVIAIPVTANDFSPDPLAIVDISQPQNGTAAGMELGIIEYTPNPFFFGIDTFTYTVSDLRGGFATAEVTVCVLPDNGIAITTLGSINPLNNPSAMDAVGIHQDSEPVYLHNGEFFLNRTDLMIPGRGFDFEHRLNYRNGRIFRGPLGHNWDHNYNRRLVVVDEDNLSAVRLVFSEAQIGDVARLDGNRTDLYRRNPDDSFESPAGFYTRLTRNPDGTFTERNAVGTEIAFGAPRSGGVASMTRLTDRNGNTMRFEYNDLNQMVRVNDTLGRPIDYFYNGSGLLIEVRDFIGRSVTYEYDDNQDLVAITSPAVSGTPNGNDFPDGKTVRYTYSSGFADPSLNHNLLSITAPNEVARGGPPRIVLVYDTDPDSPNVDRVLTQDWGGTNASGVPAGGTVSYEYTVLMSAPDADDFVTPVSGTVVHDRNGNQTEYTFNQLGNIVSIREFSNRDVRSNDPEFFETLFEYNRDGELIRQISPLGNITENEFDSAHPDRLRHGHVVRTTLYPDAIRSGDQDRLDTTMTYEPIYHRLWSITDPRGNDADFVPQNGGLHSPERYSTFFTYDYQEGTDFTGLAAIVGLTATEVEQLLIDAGVPMGLGDVNGDGRTDQIAGNLIRSDQPTVDLLPGSNQALVEGDTSQEVFTLSSFNDFGQMVTSVDAEGNTEHYEFYPERDPNGDGIIDNPAGDPATGGYLKQVTSDADSHPRRNSGTDPIPARIRSVNQYDAVGNVIRSIDGRGIATDFVVNELNQVVQVVVAAEHNLFGGDPSEPMPLVDFRYMSRIHYDFNDNVVRIQIEDRGNTSGVGIPGDMDVDNDVDFDDIAGFVLGLTDPDTYSQQFGLPASSTGDQDLDGDFGLSDIGGFVTGLTSSQAPLAFVDYQNVYDILDKVVEERQEVGLAEQLVTLHRYDPNENWVLSVLPEGNANSAIYDERDLLFQSISGATTAPPLALLAAGDPIDYDVRGGLACQCMTLYYDANRNLIESVDGADTDGSSQNNSDLGGPGDRTRFVYDGFDRQTSVVDSLGNQSLTQFDPAGNGVRALQFGAVGGPSPTGDGPDVLPGPVSIDGVVQSANLVGGNLLAAVESSYDELSRPVQFDTLLFVPTTPTVRPPDLADGATDLGKANLTEGDDQGIPGITAVDVIGRVTSRAEYDRNSRPTFTIEDDGDTSRAFYDGMDRPIQTMDPEGNRVETVYDANSNVIEVRESDVSQVAGVADEIFISTFFFDSLNRLQQAVNNIGQSTEYRYDSRNNLVAAADAQGPINGASISRRAFSGGNLTVNQINDFGNVSRYYYDGINRPIRQERVLTTSGTGDGQHIGASIQGVKDAPGSLESGVPTPDPNQGGGDGIIRVGTIYDRNSLTTAMIDDQGNVSLSLYDNLNRPVATSTGLTTSSTLDKESVLGPREVVTPTVETIDNPAFIPGAQINQQLGAAKTRIDAVDSLFTALADRVDPPTTVVRGLNQEGLVLILEDENDNEVFARYDALNRMIAGRIFRSGQSDSHSGDPLFAPAPTSDPFNLSAAIPAVVGTNSHDIEYDGLSRLTRATDNNDPTDPDDDSVISYAYDSLSRLLEETQQIGSLPAKVISSSWRSENLRSGLTYPSARVIAATYDLLDRVDTISDRGADQPIVDYNYIGQGRVLERNYPISGSSLTFLDATRTVDVGYDGLRRIAQLRHLRDDGSMIVGVSHVYDRTNRKLTEEKLHAPGESELYAYDAAYRLVEFQRGTLAATKDAIDEPSTRVPLQSQWSLDGAGNWREADGQLREHSSTNEITQVDDGTPRSIGYDDEGNLTDDGTFEYRWDYADRLRTVLRKSDGVLVANYSYDGGGRRVRKVVQEEGTTDFYYSGWRVIEERDENDVLLQQYVYGNYVDEPLVMDRNLDGDGLADGPGDQRLFYHQDTLSSTHALTDTAGRIVEGYLYDAYGRQTVFQPGDNAVVDFGGDDLVIPGSASQVDNPYLFTGRRLDSETSLYHYRTRQLDPNLGRFITRDTVGTWSDAGNLGNAYSYAGNDPVNHMDPSGAFDLASAFVNVANEYFGINEQDFRILEATGSIQPIVEKVVSKWDQAIFGRSWEEVGARSGQSWLASYWYATSDFGRDHTIGMLQTPWEAPLPGIVGGKDVYQGLQAHDAGVPVKDIAYAIAANEAAQGRDFITESVGLADFKKVSKADDWGERSFYIWTGSSKLFLTVVSLGQLATARQAATGASRATIVSAAESTPSSSALAGAIDDSWVHTAKSLRDVPADAIRRYASHRQKRAIIAFKSDEAIFEPAVRHAAQLGPGEFAWYGHSIKGGLQYVDDIVANGIVARAIKGHPGYCGQPIYFYSCEAGRWGHSQAVSAALGGSQTFGPSKLINAKTRSGRWWHSTQMTGSTPDALIETSTPGRWISSSEPGS